MQEDSIIRRVTIAIAGFSAGAVALSFFLWGAAGALAATVGGGIAVANWLGLRWVAARARKNPQAMILLAPKSLLLLVGMGLIVVYGSLDLRGLGLGLGGLVIGLVGGALASAKLYASDPAAEPVEEAR